MVISLSEKETKIAEKERKRLLTKESPFTKTVNEMHPEDQFLREEILDLIYDEIDLQHKEDHLEKMALFIVAVSAELPDPSDRCSVALKGNSSAGKDNMVKAIFSLFPSEDSLFLTRGTTSALEEESNLVKRIAFSEINKEREGANSEITETFKQLSEGGVTIIKKDARTGFKTNVKIKSDQKSLFYCTTETNTDEELSTRHIIIPVRGSLEKNKIVVDDAIDKACNEEYALRRLDKEESWVVRGIRTLDNELHVIIPFLHLFKNKIKDIDGSENFLFDFRKERIMRDAKRLFSLTKAVAWILQKQRVQYELEGKKFLLAEPSDFLITLKLFSQFFELTYNEMDHRLLTMLETIKDEEGKHREDIVNLGFVDTPDKKYSEWVLRNKIQDKMGKSLNTIKKWVNMLKDRNLIECHYNPSVTNKAYLIRPVNRPVKDVSLPVSLIGVDRLLTGYLIGETIYKKHGKVPDLANSLKFWHLAKQGLDKLTGEKLTCQKIQEIHT